MLIVDMEEPEIIARWIWIEYICLSRLAFTFTVIATLTSLLTLQLAFRSTLALSYSVLYRRCLCCLLFLWLHCWFK